MSLIKGFQSTNIWKAFTLNSMAAALVIMVAMTINSKLDNYRDKNGDKIEKNITFQSVITTILITFIASMTAYTILHFVFGYGRGQLA